MGVDMKNETKKIGIIDADLLDKGTRHPNLALMKISGYYKDKGHPVELLKSYDRIDTYEKVFISRVFTNTNVPIGIEEKNNVTVGGTGYFGEEAEDLPNDIEHHMPDYNLYNDYVREQIENGKKRSYYKDYLDYSIGFTTRGCFRKCPFCVNRKYNEVFLHSPVSEFFDPKKKKIYLWDDNFFGYDKWNDILNDLVATDRPFQFRQGLDIRLITKDKAIMLSKVKYFGDFIFAFDNVADLKIVSKKLEVWKKYCKRSTKLYLFCAYTSQDEKDIEEIFIRVKVLMKYGCLPYLMRYQDYKGSKWEKLYTTIARWLNQPQFYKKMSFREFCKRNQYYSKTGRICSSLRSMNSFESEFPKIARKYFDLKYENLNQYK